MNYIIRELKKDEIHLLNDFLYEAIFLPEGTEAPLKSIIKSPDLQVYISDFGNRKDDRCLVAEIILKNRTILSIMVRNLCHQHTI